MDIMGEGCASAEILTKEAVIPNAIALQIKTLLVKLGLIIFFEPYTVDLTIKYRSKINYIVGASFDIVVMVE
ncbi:LysR family transcriptional regulator [Aphanothece sacrum FPU1]|uniref:LysR family transcriptional regulator n=1 Tax=Aphanothece sacrum FPU1 TaxID=1920663 RepID=A0A401ILT4_APHSA|nr:LysR family transcriptional regulator [Aphanothece sacrum FPU1]GBF87250.1 LysR family transcriptional regulator [Aphanothece sacrum FPU3]